MQMSLDVKKLNQRGLWFKNKESDKKSPDMIIDKESDPCQEGHRMTLIPDIYGDSGGTAAKPKIKLPEPRKSKRVKQDIIIADDEE